MKQIIVATGNAHKVEEIEILLEGAPVKIESARVCGGMPDVDENGDTFAANARIKAEALKAQAPSDAWVLADDSGLEVYALDGAPGIYSARYAGAGSTDQKNVDKLLGTLGGVAGGARGARFKCVLCLIGPDGLVDFFEGSCEGRIALQQSGESGFGYDPVFIPEGYKQSFAELGDGIKSELSHRAKAVLALRGSL